MGKTETIGIIVITLILFAWMYFNTPKEPTQVKGEKQATEQSAGSKAESAATSGSPGAPGSAGVLTRGKRMSNLQAADTAALRLYGRAFAPLAHGATKTITIETNLYTAVLTTQGGMIKDWTLTKYKTWNGYPLELVNYDHNGDYSLLFQSSDGKLIDSKNLYFGAPFKNGTVIKLGDHQSYKLSFVLTVGDSSQIIRDYTFTNGQYNFGSQVIFRNMQSYIADYQYQVVWAHGLNYTEQNSVDESNFSKAYADNGGDIVSVVASNEKKPANEELNGRTSWVAQTTKYFESAIVTKGEQAEGAYLHGTETTLPNNGLEREYVTALQMKYSARPVQVDSFMVYIGPRDYDLLKSYNVGLEETVGMGFKWIIRPIAEYIMLPSFEFIHSFIPNYGIVIIIFSIVLKILLNPLTLSSMKSMRKMQALQPMMNDIKEKYKEDPQKMNQAVMNLYKEYKINPLGGCLPMVLQLPILYALWAIFESNIALRQSNFIWWIKDLSVPDTILRLPFTVPIIGMNQVSGLALLMAITMFVQQKMTIKDPRQQFMVWFMPVMFWVLFNNFPAGLNLYYFVFNLLSIGQQYLMNRKPSEELLVKPAQQKKKPTRPPRPAIGNRSMRRMQ